ncbi:MAG: hypothetical protein R3E13_01365 [Alphaproteobacteria bacterium]
MIIRKDMHPLRKVFRGFLLVLLGFSAVFFAGIVGLRIVYHKGMGLQGPLQTALFHADVMQFKTVGYFNDDAQDFELAKTLLSYHIFSPIYSHAGYDMLVAQAEAGYAPAQELLKSVARPPDEPIRYVQRD